MASHRALGDAMVTAQVFAQLQGDQSSVTPSEGIGTIYGRGTGKTAPLASLFLETLDKAGVSLSEITIPTFSMPEARNRGRSWSNRRPEIKYEITRTGSITLNLPSPAQLLKYFDQGDEEFSSDMIDSVYKLLSIRAQFGDSITNQKHPK